MRFRTIEYKWLVAAAFIVGIFMDVLDATVVNVALPTLGREFHVGNSTLEWVVTGYLLSLAIWIPASGWIGDRFGTRKTFLFALAIFTFGSALCGIAWNIESLIAFRLLQGVGGGMLTPVGTAMLFRAFPPAERARASAVMGVPIVIAPALGPVLGGWLVDTVGWRWIFFINLPIGILGFLFTFVAIREHREERAGRFDLWGFALSGAGLALVLYALARGPNDGWSAANVLVAGVTGIACVVALIRVELRRKEPMLDLRLFRDRMFRNANLAGFMAIAGLIGLLFLLPLFLQQLRGLSALDSGLATFPQALGLIAVTPLVSRMYPHIGPRRLMVAGLVFSACTAALFLLVDLDTNLWWIRILMFVRGIGFPIVFIPMQTATFATIRPQDTGRASALFNAGRQVASSVGVAALATTLVSRTKARVAEAVAATPGTQQATQHGALLGFHDAFVASVILAVIGAAFAFLIRDEDAASTMVPHGAGEEASAVAVR
ncbi:MAG: MDR family MFS transporter [Thermomicrobiales bacterium]